MRWPIRFCPDCGARLQQLAVRNSVACQDCGASHYLNAKPCAGALIERDGRVLLARRAREPRKGAWDVVGGFVEPDEHPAEAAVRECREETGLDVELVDMLAMFVDTYRYATEFTLNIYYLCRAPSGEPEPSSDVTELGWFACDALPDDLAFPHERELLAMWAQRVRDTRRTRRVRGTVHPEVDPNAGGC